MPKDHHRDYFYKYMTSDTALAVLENCSLRWREPRQFNDPFDHQMSFRFPYTQAQFITGLAEEVERLVYSDDESEFVKETRLSLVIQMLRARREFISKDKILPTLHQGVAKSAERFQQYQSDINSLIANDLNRSRVLCVSENNDNVVMWSHYAASHTGACIRLQCIEEIDNTLLMAKPVNYEDSFPVFPSLQDHIKDLTGEKPIDFVKLIYRIPYIKHKHWSYENEWRVHIPHEEPENENGFNDWRENPRVFGAMYFGCRISPKDMYKLMQIVGVKYPHMELYSSHQSDKEFKIEFNRIK